MEELWNICNKMANLNRYNRQNVSINEINILCNNLAEALHRIREQKGNAYLTPEEPKIFICCDDDGKPCMVGDTVQITVPGSRVANINNDIVRVEDDHVYTGKLEFSIECGYVLVGTDNYNNKIRSKFITNGKSYACHRRIVVWKKLN